MGDRGPEKGVAVDVRLTRLHQGPQRRSQRIFDAAGDRLRLCGFDAVLHDVFRDALDDRRLFSKRGGHASGVGQQLSDSVTKRLCRLDQGVNAIFGPTFGILCSFRDRFPIAQAFEGSAMEADRKPGNVRWKARAAHLQKIEDVAGVFETLVENVSKQHGVRGIRHTSV